VEDFHLARVLLHSGCDQAKAGGFIRVSQQELAGGQCLPVAICANLTNFVELRGGDYFFMPSLTALQMMASGTVDPR